MIISCFLYSTVSSNSSIRNISYRISHDVLKLPMWWGLFKKWVKVDQTSLCPSLLGQSVLFPAALRMTFSLYNLETTWFEKLIFKYSIWVTVSSEWHVQRGPAIRNVWPPLPQDWCHLPIIAAFQKNAQYKMSLFKECNWDSNYFAHHKREYVFVLTTSSWHGKSRGSRDAVGHVPAVRHIYTITSTL